MKKNENKIFNVVLVQFCPCPLILNSKIRRKWNLNLKEGESEWIHENFFPFRYAHNDGATRVMGKQKGFSPIMNEGKKYQWDFHEKNPLLCPLFFFARQFLCFKREIERGRMREAMGAGCLVEPLLGWGGAFNTQPEVHERESGTSMLDVLLDDA